MQPHPAFKQFIFIIASILLASLARAVEIDMVTVGNPGNAPDTQVMNDGTTGYGSVAYEYAIGKYEVTAGQYCDFLNAKAKSDPYGLYSDAMWSHLQGCKIEKSGSEGSFSYAVEAENANLPVNFISFWDAARFTNWLNNGKGNGDTERGAYTLNGYNGLDGGSIAKNPDVTYWIPSENEWYKAAYYDPNKGGPSVGGYWLYPTKSDITPVAEAPPGENNSANFGFALNYATPVGAYTQSFSPFGTFDQGGNLLEITDTIAFESVRYMRGGGYNFFNADSGTLAATYRTSGIFFSPTSIAPIFGFRIASVLNPTSYVNLNASIAPGPVDWGVQANWETADVPDGSGKKARFGNQPASNNIIDLGTSDRTLGELSFTYGTDTTIESTDGYSLILENGDRPSTIHAYGNHSISVPVVLNGDVLISGSGALHFAAGISGPHILTITDGTISASSIEVDTLTIGKSTTQQAVPEPCTFFLLASGIVGYLIVKQCEKRIS